MARAASDSTFIPLGMLLLMAISLCKFRVSINALEKNEREKWY